MTTDPILEAPDVIAVLSLCERDFYPDLETTLSPAKQRHFERLLADGDIVEIPGASPRRYCVTRKGRGLLTMLLHAQQSREHFRARRRRTDYS